MTSDQIPSLGTSLVGLIREIGTKLGFDVLTEVEASESAWVDVVWFDSRLSPHSMGTAKPKIRRAPVLPVVGFEVEVRTGLDVKHIKGSVSNLNNLGAQLGVVVIGAGNLQLLRESALVHREKTEGDLDAVLMERLYRWVYAESQPRGRVVIMSEQDVVDWARRLGVSIPG